MAEFAAVLKKTIAGLGNDGPDVRAKVYDKARQTIAAKIAAISPPPSPAVVERQRRMLEDAIAVVEAEYAAAAPADELEQVFASLKDGPAAAPPKAKTPARPAPRPAERQPAPVRREVPTTETGDGEPAGAPDDVPDRWNDVLVPRPRRIRLGAVAALVALLALVGGGTYAVWLNRAEFSALLGLGGPAQVAVTTPKPVPPAAPKPAEPAKPAAAKPQPAAAQPAKPAEPLKFTQRLTADGQEIDTGPSRSAKTVGEGTSVAAVTTPPSAPAAPPAAAPAAPQQPAAPAPAAQAPQPAAQSPQPAAPSPAPAAPAPVTAATAPQQVPVGQRAIFYEERTNTAEGSAQNGSIVWSLVQESPGGDLPPEPAIRAEATIPGRDVQLRMTIRRNGDKTLPASHIIEMIFLTPGNFQGGGVDNVLRVAMKDSEQSPGSPLLGIPAKIADGFFLVALTDTPAETQANTTLLRGQSWLDIAVSYKSGRRALITMEKGIPGAKVFDEALRAWAAASSG